MKKRKRSAAPIYTFAIAWVLLANAMPLYKLSHFVAVAVIAAIPTALVTALVRKKNKPIPPEPDDGKSIEPEEAPKKSYGSDVDEILAENRRAQMEMGRLYASIANPEIKKKIRNIMEISDKIAQDAIDDPSDVPQIRKFQNYYLPTTIKLLNAYDRMGAQGIEGENISGTMRSIEEMLDTATDAYRKQLDSLFANQALDIESDIQVMNTLLKRQGFTRENI